MKKPEPPKSPEDELKPESYFVWETAVSPVAGSEGDTVTLTVTVKGVPANGLYDLDIDFGDGYTLTKQPVPASDGNGDSTVTFTHRYANNPPLAQGTDYKIRVTPYYSQFRQPLDTYSGMVDSAQTMKVSIANAAPVVSIVVTPPATAGGAHTLQGSFTDPGSNDTHTYVWNIGGQLVSGSLLVNHVFTAPTTVTLRVTDNDGGIGESTVFIPVPLAAAGQGTGASALTLAQVQSLLTQAKSLWVEAGAEIGALDTLSFAIEDLPGALLALVSLEADGPRLTLDRDAAGNGWFVDATPVYSEEFTQYVSAEARRAITGDAAARVDLLTVLAHEFGHVLGLSHVDTNVAANSVMIGALELGVRRLPLTVDLTRALGGLLINGSFGIDDAALYEYGWHTSGAVTVSDGEAVIGEDAHHNSRLTQTFKLPVDATRMQFTITGGSLSSATGIPPDAFEAALLDPSTLQPLVGTIGLGGSDAFFNLQSDGTVYRAGTVRVTDLQGNALSMIDLSRPVLVTVDLGNAIAGHDAALYFDLLGFGALDTTIRIDDVRFLGPQTVNVAPVAHPDLATVAEDASVLIDVLANDSDADGDFIAVLDVGEAVHGTVRIEDGKVRYTPEPDYNGGDSFSYRIIDTFGNVAVASVAVTVSPVNDAPVLAPIDDYQVVEGVALELVVSASDVDGDALEYRLDAAPAGAVIDAQTGRITWTASGPGTDVLFTVTVSDGVAQSSGSFTVSVLPAGGANRAPLAVADIASVQQGTSVLIDVLANDVDPEGAALAIDALVQPVHGSAVVESGRVRYTPADGFTGTDSFRYTVVDPEGASAQGTVTVTVVPGNRAPVVQAIADLELVEGTELRLQVQANDPEGDPLSYRLIAAPDGALIDAASGLIRWTAAGADASHGFSVVVSDGERETTLSFLVMVLPPPVLNLPPVANADAATVFTGSSVLIDVLANDVDPEGEALAIDALTQPANGVAVIEGGRVRYTPADGFIGTDSFTYVVVDPLAATATTTVTVEVQVVPNTAPVANDDAVSVDEDASVLVDVLANDSDVDGDVLTILEFTPVQHGTAVIEDGRIRYTPSANFHGSDELVYRIGDGRGGEATARVLITVRSVNDAPVAVDDRASVAEDGTVLIDVLANDHDIDGDALTLALGTAPEHGSAVIEDGQIRYTPAADFNGTDRFTYRVTDPDGASVEATVTVTVEAVNDAPRLAPVEDAYISVGQVFRLQLQGSDVDGDTLSYHLLTGPAGAELDAESGVLTWRPTRANTLAQFTVAVRDASGAEAAQRFTLRVRPPVVEEAILVVPVPAEPNRYAFTRDEAIAPRREITVRGGFVALEPLGGLAQPMLVDTVGREPGSMRPVTGQPPQPPAGARALLWVERFVPLLDGFAVRFNQRIDTEGLDMVLDDAGRGSTGAPDIVINGPDGRPVAGTITLDADGRGFRFVAANGQLAGGAYEVLLRSGVDAFHGFFGALDGNRDGQGGDDYRTRFDAPARGAQSASAVTPVVPAGPEAQAGAGRVVVPERQVPAGSEQAAAQEAEEPRIEFGESYAGFVLAGTLAFGAAPRRDSGERTLRRWQRELLFDSETERQQPNRSLTIRLDP